MKMTALTTPHLTQEQIECFASPTDTPDAERTRANAHIQSCAPCRAAFQQVLSPHALGFLTGQETTAKCTEESMEECVDDTLMVRYVLGTATGVEIDMVEMHLETCALCHSEAAELTAYYKGMAETFKADNDRADKAKSVTETIGAREALSLATGKPTPSPLSKVGKANLAPALRTRLRLWPAGTHLNTGFMVGGSALAGAVAMLLVLSFRQQPFQQPASNGAASTAKLRQSEQTIRTLEEQMTRQERQAQTALQNAQRELKKEKRALDQEKTAHRSATQLLAHVQEQSNLLQANSKANLEATVEAKTESDSSPRAMFLPGLKFSEQIAEDGKGHYFAVAPVDPQEARPLRVGRLDFPAQQLASLAKAGEKTMGGFDEEPIQLLHPQGTFVSSLRPTFAWHAVPHASAYKLTCIPQNKNIKHKPEQKGAEAAPYVSYTVTATSISASSINANADAKIGAKLEIVWTIPASSPALKTETTYTWTVQALDVQAGIIAGSSKSEELFFGTLTAEEIDQVEHKSKRYHDNPLLMGVFYAQLGVLEEANQAFANCLKTNPTNAMAHKMQKQVQAQQMTRH